MSRSMSPQTPCSSPSFNRLCQVYTRVMGVLSFKKRPFFLCPGINSVSFSPLIQGPSRERMWVKPGFQEPSFSELWRLAYRRHRAHGGPEGSQLLGSCLVSLSTALRRGSAPLGIAVSAFGWVLGASLSPEFTQEGLCQCLELALL